MVFEFKRYDLKRYELLKFSFIFSIVFFLFLNLQTLAFSDIFSTNHNSLASTKEPNLTDSIKKNFSNTSDDNNKTGYQNPTINEQKIKIVAAGDFGCGPVAQSNIKQVELQKPDIFLVIGDLSYEPSLDCWYDMTKALDTKTKIAIGNHEGDEEKEKGGSQELTNSLLKHYNLPNSYYSFNFGNIHFLALDTQLEFSFNIFKPEDEEEEEENTNYRDKSNIVNGKSYATTLDDLLTKYNITAEIPLGYLLNNKMIVENIPFDTEQYKFVVSDLEKASTNSSIDWIIVMFHKPIYSSLSSHMQEYIMREKLSAYI
jgi:Calcineurin-like phosphoesterase